MDPAAATSAAAAHGHLITATRRPLPPSPSPPASEGLAVDPALPASSSVDSPCPVSATSPASHAILNLSSPPEAGPVVCRSSSSSSTPARLVPPSSAVSSSPPCLETLPSEMLILVLSFLDVDDVFHLSRTCHRLRRLCLDPVVKLYRLRNARLTLASLLSSPSRPTLSDLISRFIFMTNNTVISRRLARSLVSIRLARRLAQRPSADALVQRAVLPRECVPGMGPVLVAPALVAKRKAIEKERLKDSLRRWIAGKWRGEVKEREACVRRHDEAHGVGRVWRLRRFWEKVSRGEAAAQ